MPQDDGTRSQYKLPHLRLKICRRSHETCFLQWHGRAFPWPSLLHIPLHQLSFNTHAQTNVHWETTFPQLVLQTAHYCTILARLNHSLMGGLTDWYCYSLWGLALHTNRRLSRSRCQRRRSGYLHAYNGLEWNPTGGNLPCPPGTSECHNMGYLEGRGDSGEGYRQSVKNCDPYVTSYMQTTLPWGAASPKTCSALVR